MGASESTRVGVLSLHNSKETKAILNAVEALGHQPRWLRNENTTIRIDPDGVQLRPEVDVVANRLLLTNTDSPGEEIGLLHSIDDIVPVLNPPIPVLTAVHKFATATRLHSAGVPVPEALLALDTTRLDADRASFGPQVVYKTAIGTHGGGTWKIDRSQPLGSRAGDRQAFLQQLVENGDHCDVRVYVVDGTVVGAMYRYAPDEDWRTNVSLGGGVEDATADLPAVVERRALQATDVLGLDYAGVDLIEGADEWYVLEVNATAGFTGLFEATGRSAAPHIAKLAIEEAGGTVDVDRVEDLETTLDNSVPACKPTSESTPGSDITIGYIEEVDVGGVSGSERVLAKADTGAARTSIDTDLAASIRAGPVQASTSVRAAGHSDTRNRPVVDVVLSIGGARHTVAASIEDRSHMEYPVLLGRDVLTGYRVDVQSRVADGEGRIEE